MADTVKPGMSSQEVDNNILFEKFTIDEIRNIESKTRQDIERKKEDLRQMVGERYRDLIEAADTISDMKTSAENVMQSISRMQDHCKTLKEMKLIRTGGGMKQKTRADINRKKDESQFYDIATQIKLLLDTPEKVWSAIDTGNYLQATQLYLLARHINTALQLDSHQSAKIHAWFPVLARQWAAISHFRTTILQGCKEVLKNADISEQDIANSLCSIMLLEDSTPRQVFTGFLLARAQAVQYLFHPDQHSSSIKTQVCDVVHLICTTIHQIHAVFYSGNVAEGDPSQAEVNLLMKTLEKITDRANPESVILKDHGGCSWKYVPDSVKDFRPVLRTPATSIPLSQLQEKCLQWIETCNQDVNSGISKLLEYINSVKGLAAVRDALWTQLGEDARMESWDMKCQDIFNKKVSVWEDFFRPLFFSRIKTVLQTQMDNALDTMKQNLTKYLNDFTLTRDSPASHDQDLSAYIWFEGAGDIPSGSAWIPAHSKTLAEGGGLMMKAKAYTSTIQSVCKNFDSKLSCTLEDGSHYTSGENAESEGAFNRFADNEMMEKFLYTACNSCIQRLLEYMEKTIYSSSKQLENSQDREGNMIIINRVLLCGRLCSALCELSPHLQKCIVGTSDRNKDGSDSKVFKRQQSKLFHRRQQDDPKFSELKNKLIEQSIAAYSLWSEHISKCLVQQYELSLLDTSSQAVLLGSTRWDEIDIQEETEDGKNIKSKIRVPMQASWYTHSLLYSLCNEINRIGGHAIKRSVIVNFVDKVSDGILVAYEKIAKSAKKKTDLGEDAVPLTQNRALQLMFDVKFLSGIFSRREDNQENKLFTKRMHRVLDMLENHVDPFDLDVFSPYVQSHIMKQTQRCSALYGALVNLDKHSSLTSSRMPPASTQEQHNIMPLVSGVPRLTLLPLSTTPRSVGIQPMVLQPKAKISQPGSIEDDMPSIPPDPSVLGHKRSSSLYNRLGTIWFSNTGGKV